MRCNIEPRKIIRWIVFSFITAFPLWRTCLEFLQCSNFRTLAVEDTIISEQINTNTRCEVKSTRGFYSESDCYQMEKSTSNIGILDVKMTDAWVPFGLRLACDDRN